MELNKRRKYQKVFQLVSHCMQIPFTNLPAPPLCGALKMVHAPPSRVMHEPLRAHALTGLPKFGSPQQLEAAAHSFPSLCAGR